MKDRTENLEPVKLHDVSTYIGVVLMWYGYAFEAIYVALGTLLVPAVLGILIYH